MTTGLVATRVLDALGAALRRRGGPVLDQLVDGLVAPLQDIDDRLTTTDRGWPAAFDLNHTPDPRWVGAATGTKVPGGLDVEQARDYVRGRAYWRRGTPAAIKAAAAALLTGSKRVDLIERDGSPWRLTVQVYAVEAAATSHAALLAAVLEQKPVGLVLTVEILTSASWDHITAEHGTWDDVLAEFGTWDNVATHVPEPGTEP